MNISKLIVKFGLALLLFSVGCTKIDENNLDKPENHPIGSIPINIVLTNDNAQDPTTRTSVSNSNIDKYYLQIDQEGEEYDYFLLMKRTYTATNNETSAHLGKDSLYRFYEKPAGVWSEWEMYDIYIDSESGNIVISDIARTEPLYFYDLSKNVISRARKWDHFDSSILTITDGKVDFSSAYKKIELKGNLTPEQLYSYDILGYTHNNTPTKDNNTGEWGINIELKHLVTKLKIDIVFKDNFHSLFENYDNVDGGDNQTIINDLIIEPSTNNLIEYVFETELKSLSIYGKINESYTTPIKMTPIFFGKKDTKWMASYETYTTSQSFKAPQVNDYNLKVQITTNKFNVDLSNSKYTIDSTKKDRLFEYTTTNLTLGSYGAGKLVHLTYEVGDDYPTSNPY